MDLRWRGHWEGPAMHVHGAWMAGKCTGGDAVWQAGTLPASPARALSPAVSLSSSVTWRGTVPSCRPRVLGLLYTRQGRGSLECSVPMPTNYSKNLMSGFQCSPASSLLLAWSLRRSFLLHGHIPVGSRGISTTLPSDLWIYCNVLFMSYDLI